MSTASHHQEQQHAPAGDSSAPAATPKEDKKPLTVTFSFNVTSSEEVQARLDAADLAVREAEYEKNLLVHQLEADSHERTRLQAALKELALQHRRVVRAAMAAELEASNLRQQAADASAAASTAQAQAVQAVQSAQQQLALLQTQQQQYTGTRPPYTTGRVPSYSNVQSLNQPFMMGTIGGRRTSQAQASPKSTAAQSNADLTEGLFDDMDGGPWGVPGGSHHNLFAPELYSYPYGSNYAKKRLSTSSAPGVSTAPPLNPPSGPREQRQPSGNAAAEAAGAAAGAAAAAAHATAEEPKSVHGEPQSAAREAAAAAQGTMVQASTRLAADGVVQTGDKPSTTPASTGTDKNTDKNEVSTTQLVDRAPSPVTSTEVETAPEEETEDSVSTTTHVGEGTGKRRSSDKQREPSRPVTPPQTPKSTAIEEHPQLEEASQHNPAQAPSGHPWHALSHPLTAGRVSPEKVTNRTSMDVALSEVQGVMGQMYKTQSDDSLAPRLSASPSLQRLPMSSAPSEPDLASRKHDGGPAAIYLPMVGNQHTGGTETPSLASGTLSPPGQEQKQQAEPESVPLRQQLVRLSTCSVTGEEARRNMSGIYGSSPPSSTLGNAIFGTSPGKNFLSSKPGTLRKINSDTHALSASQLLSHSPFSPPSSLHPTVGEAHTDPPGQPGNAAFQLESAGSLSEGFVGVAGETEPLPPVALRASSVGMPGSTNRMGGPSPFTHCRSFTAHQHSDADFLSPSRSGLVGHYSYGGTQQQLEPQLSSSLPPGPSLVRPFASVHGTGQPPAVHVRNARSGSVSPGAYGMLPGSANRVSSGGIQAEAAKPSQLYGAGSFKLWGAPVSRPQTRSGVETPHSTGALSLSRGRSGAISPRHPLLAAQPSSQSKLDENLHLLQALDKITRDRHKEINEELESVQHEDDLLSHQGFRTGVDKGGQEAARLSKLQEELSRAKAEASRAEAERAEAMRARHEVAVHFQSVLAEQQQKQKQQQAERASRQGSGSTPPGGTPSGDVCNVIGDEAMRQRCRDLLADILGPNSGEEQQVPPSYVVAPAAPVAPIHVQQQMNAVQSMLSQMEKVVGRLNESLEREEASRAEKEAMEQRLANLESKVLPK